MAELWEELWYQESSCCSPFLMAWVKGQTLLHAFVTAGATALPARGGAETEVLLFCSAANRDGDITHGLQD